MRGEKQSCGAEDWKATFPLRDARQASKATRAAGGAVLMERGLPFVLFRVLMGRIPRLSRVWWPEDHVLLFCRWCSAFGLWTCKRSAQPSPAWSGGVQLGMLFMSGSRTVEETLGQWPQWSEAKKQSLAIKTLHLPFNLCCDSHLRSWSPELMTQGMRSWLQAP